MFSEVELDNQSIISDITDSNTVLSVDIESKLDEINAKAVVELNKMNIDGLKEKCKELGISGFSKMKKPELVSLLSNEFMKLFPLLKEKKLNELKTICKQFGIKGIASAKKESLIYQILLQYVSPLRFKLESSIMPPILEEQKEEKINEKKEVKVELSAIEKLEQRRIEIENKMKEELEKQKLEEIKKIEEEQKKIKEEEEEKKKENKRKKQAIPKNVRTIIWNNYIGEDIIKHKCLCCKKATICNTNFEVGHVLSEKNGGTHEINNLRPICFACNHSMGTENMVDYVVKYGLFIG